MTRWHDRRIQGTGVALAVAGALASGCNCGPGHPGSDGSGGSSTGDAPTSTAVTDPSASATSAAASTGPGSASSGEPPGTETTTGDSGDVPPWDGTDPSCGDGVAVSGIYCYGRVDLQLPNNPVALADFDADSHLDIMIGGYAIVFGDGTGAFSSPVDIPEPDEVPQLVSFTMVGEFDGQPGIDLLSAGSGGIAVQLNDGTGTAFDNVVVSEIPEVNLLDVVRAIRLDLDGDGVHDVLGTNSGAFDEAEPELQPLLNDGSGSFAATPPAMSHGEFGADLVAWVAELPPVGEAGPGAAILGTGNNQPIVDFPIVVARANGAGSATYTKVDHMGADARAIAAADLTGDGVVDLVVWNAGDGAFVVYQGNANGGFAPLATLAAESLCPGCPCQSCASPGASTLLGGDFDGDTTQDFIVRDNAVWVVLDPLGEASGVWLDDTWPGFIGDFNEDDVDDILTLQGELLLSAP